MDNIMLWIWIAAAVLFLVAEIFTAGFFIFCFGIGAAGAAGVALFWPEAYVWQLATFVALSAVAIVLARPFAERVTGKQPQEFGAARLLGQRAIVVETIDPLTGSGRVRADREQWRADSADGETIPPGSTVLILQVRGTHLVVRRERASTAA